MLKHPGKLMNRNAMFAFTPNYIPGLALWLDAADTDTITESSGSVSQWDDKSANAITATQGTGSAQPTTNATTQNGLNVIDLDGSDNLALSSGAFSIPEEANTAIIVAKRTSEDATFDGIFGFRTDGTNKYFMSFQTTAGQIDFRSNNAGSSSVSNTGNTNTDFQVIIGRRVLTTQGLAVDGGTEATNASGSDITGIDAAFIGSTTDASLFLTGNIAEIIFYKRSLDTLELSAVETYLTTKWGI